MVLSCESRVGREERGKTDAVDGFDAGTSNESEKIVEEEVGGFTGISHEQEIVLKPFVTM